MGRWPCAQGCMVGGRSMDDGWMVMRWMMDERSMYDRWMPMDGWMDSHGWIGDLWMMDGSLTDDGLPLMDEGWKIDG